MNSEATFEKPKKPNAEEYGIDKNDILILKEFNNKCRKKENNILLLTFLIMSAAGILFTFQANMKTNLKYGYSILILISAAIFVWFIIPYLFKKIAKCNLNEYIFKVTINNNVSIINSKNNLYELALNDYKTKNEFYERVLRRATWQYWLSLSPIDFEEAVGELFLDQGYKVRTTRATGDNGVDLYLEKDGKKIIVQCKTYKKTIGPNAARELYGTMTAEGAHEAILAAPSGFTQATHDFCRQKPIKLMDIDDLTKMKFSFENYTPYWIDSSKSIEDLARKVNKMAYSGRRRKY
jgi:hypothetical protein